MAEEPEKPKNYSSSLCFGTDGGTFKSEAMENFNEKEINRADRMASHANAKYLRGRHWELGHDSFRDVASTMRRDFGPKKASNAEAKEAMALKKDLTREHYHLGFEGGGAMQSVYHTDMGPASVYADAGATSYAKAEKPPTSISLGSDGATLRTTSMGAYVRHALDVHMEDGKARGKQLRKSNLLIGTDDPVWQTRSSEAYRDLHGRPAEPVIRKTDQNVTFGTDKAKYETEVQSHFSGVTALNQACRERESLDPELKADLRGSHFTLGTDFQRSQSCAQAAFTEKKATAGNRDEQIRIRSAMKQVYMTLGNDKPHLISSMKAGFTQPPQEMLLEAAKGEVRDERKRIMQKASYTLGTDDKAAQAARFQSLAHEDMSFGVSEVDYSKLNGLSEEVKADLRKHHFSFGIDPSTQKTTSQAAYVSPPDGKWSGAMDAAVKADLRSSHFELGTDNYKNLSTTTADQMVYHGTVKASLDPALKADLRAVHYVLGRDAMPKHSTYGSNYTHPRLS
jgi:hypothetical protein